MTVNLHICFAQAKGRKVAKLPCRKGFIAGIGVGRWQFRGSRVKWQGRRPKAAR